MEKEIDPEFSALVTNYFQHDYRERGIKKWRGFFLSDHTSALNREAMKQQENEKQLPQMSLDEIKRIALRAGANYHFVSVQLNEMNYNHEIKKSIFGMVDSVNDRFMLVDDKKIMFDTVRSINLLR